MHTPLGKLGLRPGTQIHILTKFQLSSEAPRPCFTFNYVKGANLKCDYFKCTDCKLNWVCQPCAIQCHKGKFLPSFVLTHLHIPHIIHIIGHTLVPFMMNHQPSYACCYCVKKKKCKIENIKTKRNG